MKKVFLYFLYIFCIILIILWSFASFYASEFAALHYLNNIEIIKKYILSGWYFIDVIPIFLIFYLIKFIKKKYCFMKES